MKRLGHRSQLSEPDLGRLGVVGARSALPLPRQKADCEAMGQVAIRIAERVGLGLREAGEWDQVLFCNPKAGLLQNLVYGSLGEAAADLSCACREAPAPVICALGQKDLPVIALQDNHRARHEDERLADLLPQAPKVGADVGHRRRIRKGREDEERAPTTGRRPLVAMNGRLLDAVRHASQEPLDHGVLCGRIGLVVLELADRVDVSLSRAMRIVNLSGSGSSKRSPVMK